ncbi:HXXEE domain-containing protein [Polaribacter cellanae]|uniref:HXXEE domain-containing protein n=1 Tax=Polaribacter cellanae TaxID=2818493 RepID=A0A975CMH8_9FLAO|nr:HXXEE domain-containing protein [Polaribacter cellanae]QTE21802.1 HXXEE domain-containing protein [Polaribacter cellanae]
MELNLNTLIILLPFAFALHNFEEILGMEKWTKSIPIFIHKPVTTRQFGIAVILFTILGFAITFSKELYQTEKYYYLIITGFSGMLFLNVFFPHLLAVIYLRKYAPGIITGLLINLPLTITILLLVKDSEILSQKQMIFSVIAGGLIGIFLAFIFLKIGKFWDFKKVIE